MVLQSRRDLGFEWIYICKSFGYNTEILYLRLVCVVLITARNKILDILIGIDIFSFCFDTE